MTSRKVIVSFTLSPETDTQLYELARSLKKFRSAIVEEALQRLFKKLEGLK